MPILRQKRHIPWSINCAVTIKNCFQLLKNVLFQYYYCLSRGHDKNVTCHLFFTWLCLTNARYVGVSAWYFCCLRRRKMVVFAVQKQLYSWCWMTSYEHFHTHKKTHSFEMYTFLFRALPRLFSARIYLIILENRIWILVIQIRKS